MPKPAISIEGGDAIRRRMKLLTRNVREDVSQTLDDLADELLTDARNKAPVLTGLLTASSRTDSTDMRLQGRMVRKVRFFAPYAKYQDKYPHWPGPGTAAKLGSGFGVAQGFLTKTQRAFKPEVMRRLKASVERAIRQTLR